MTSRCVIDVGNTSIASALYVDGEILSPLRNATRHISILHDVVDLIDNVRTRTSKDFHGIVACVGVSSVRDLLEEYAQSTSTNIHFVSGTNLSGARIDYETPETLGPDRIANAIAAAKLYEQPTLVIDCGTAITMDVINSEGIFEGGMIASGVETSLNALTHFAPSLPAVGLTVPTELVARNTVECIQSGVVYGAAAMIDSVIVRVAQYNPSLVSVITGGHSSLLVPLLYGNVIHDEWLTLRGLGLAAIS